MTEIKALSFICFKSLKPIYDANVGDNKMFVGDDWKGTPKWDLIEEKLKKCNVELIYFPYTKGTSSTLINETLNSLRKVTE